MRGRPRVRRAVVGFGPEGRPCVRKWRPVKFQTQITFSGGLLAKAVVLDTMEVRCSGGDKQTFVHVTKKDRWLAKAVIGQKAQRGAIKRSVVLQTLRYAFDKLQGPSLDDPQPSAVAEAECEDPAEDPMLALDDLPETPPKSSQGSYSSAGIWFARSVCV